MKRKSLCKVHVGFPEYRDVFRSDLVSTNEQTTAGISQPIRKRHDCFLIKEPNTFPLLDIYLVVLRVKDSSNEKLRIY